MLQNFQIECSRLAREHTEHGPRSNFQRKIAKRREFAESTKSVGGSFICDRSITTLCIILVTVPLYKTW